MDVKSFELKPRKGISNIQFGMPLGMVRNIMNEPYFAQDASISMIVPGLEIPASDYFQESAIKMEYDSNLLLSFIEMGPAIHLTFEGLDLFSKTFGQLLKHFKGLGYEVNFESGNFTIPELGITLVPHGSKDYSELAVQLLSIIPHS
jgi:hypothetical protein